jgi:hypothetical protein
MDHQVLIPPDFFFKEAKHEYWDYRLRLVTELFQNSLDAGATRINLTANDDRYECSDNGRGMSKERMISAMLTMGGSIKETGSTGGFGAAKKLILLSHKSFSIWSNDTGVEGEVLSYRFVDYGVRIGTRIMANFLPEFGGGSLIEKAKELLSRCDFSNRCQIYLNGIEFTNYHTVPFARDISGLGTVYSSKNHTLNNTVIVRHNGLFMFQRYVNDLKRDVIVETIGNSVDLFNQNRESFKGSASDLFDKFITEVTIDKEGFIKARPRKFVIEGMRSFIEHITTLSLSDEVKKAIEELKYMAPATSPAGFVQMIEERVADTPTSVFDSTSSLEKIRNCAKGFLLTDFHFDLADSTYEKVPPQFMPNTGKKKYTYLAALWKVCLRNVLSTNGWNQNFVIGFTFNKNVVATHQKRDEISCYLLNPLSSEINSGDSKTKVFAVLMTAVHEVVHSGGCEYHDETFVVKLHEMFTKTLARGATYRQLMLQAKVEKV